MTLNDICERNNKVYEKILSLENWNTSINGLLSSIRSISFDFIWNTLKQQDANLAQLRNTYIDQVNKNLNDFLDGFSMTKVHREIIALEEDSIFINSLYIERNVFYSSSDRLLNLLVGIRTNNIKDYPFPIKDLYISLEQAINSYLNLKEQCEHINHIGKMLENNIKKPEEYSEIIVYLSNKNLDLDDIIHILESTKKIYSYFCILIDVSDTEKPLIPVKIETGSLFEKFYGLEEIIKLISYTLKKIIDLIFRKFTLEGKIATKKELLEVVKLDIEIIKGLQELGLNLNLDDEKHNKIFFSIIDSTLDLAKRSSKIKIDKTEINISAISEEKYIECSKKNLIEHKQDQDNEKC